jgi:hypothetical protein
MAAALARTDEQAARSLLSELAQLQPAQRFKGSGSVIRTNSVSSDASARPPP